MTSAYYRTLAQDFEARCEWGRAIDAWNMAIDLYPAHHSNSQLAKRDLAQMEQRREDCQQMFFPA